MSHLDYRYSQVPVTFLYIAQKPAIMAGFFMVGLFGFEPKTSSMSTKRSNQLSYNPMSDECIIHDMIEICKMLFCNFLHMARQMRHPRCSSPSCYGSQFRRSTPPILSASNPSVRTPKSKQVQELLLCTCPQIVCTWRYLRNQTSLYKRIPRLAGSCKAGYSYHCSLVGLSGFEPETSSM